MSLEIWLAFVAACSILTLIPGPCVLLVVGQALTRGMPAALLCILGDMLGGVFLMTLSLVGVGAILAASATLFGVLKWAGVCYMAYLGVSQIRDARKGDKIPNLSENTASSHAYSSLRSGFLASSLNPKAIIFYMAFLSQFMDPQGDTLLQFSILVATSSAVIGIILAGYALIAAQAKKTFQSRKARKYFGYTGGGFLIGGSVLMATSR